MSRPIFPRGAAAIALLCVMLACGPSPSVVRPNTPNRAATATASALSATMTAVARSTAVARASIIATQTTLGSPAGLALNGPHTDTESGLGLQVQLIGLWIGDHSPMPELGIDCGSTLVLADNTQDYDATAVQQIATYVQAYSASVPPLAGDPGIPHPPPVNLPPLPSGLRWVQGLPQLHHCIAELQFTDIGSLPIEVDQVGIALRATPVVNSFPYRLINQCSFVHCNVVGGAEEICPYRAHVHLGEGVAGAQFGAQVQLENATDQPCSPRLKLVPGQPQDVEVTFDLSAGTPDNLVYLAEPFLTVNSNQQIALPALTSVLAFADASQFSCYDLVGNQFVPEHRVDLGATLTYIPPDFDLSQAVFCL